MATETTVVAAEGTGAGAGAGTGADEAEKSHASVTLTHGTAKSTLADIKDLAVFGGVAHFNSAPIMVGRPNLGDRKVFDTLIDGIWDSRWLTNNGPLVVQFERKIQTLLGVKHCICVCNATIGIDMALRAMGLTKGEIIVPSFTFVATAHACTHAGLDVVFADVDRSSHQLDPKSVEAAITDKTVAIMPVNVWGIPAPHDELQAIADKHGLRLVYDSAHAFGGSRGSKMFGGFGDCEVFSFHATKFMNAVEGGCVTTDDDDLAEKFRSFRNFGFLGYDRVEGVGTNAKMSEVHAAMGLTNLRELSTLIEGNRMSYRLYATQLRGLPGLTLFSDSHASGIWNHQYVVCEIDEAEFGLSRDQVVDILHKEKIIVRKYFYPGLHEFDVYKKSVPEPEKTLPNTLAITRNVMSVPTGQTVSDDDIKGVCSFLWFLHEHAAEINARFKLTLMA